MEKTFLYKITPIVAIISTFGVTRAQTVAMEQGEINAFIAAFIAVALAGVIIYGRARNQKKKYKQYKTKME